MPRATKDPHPTPPARRATHSLEQIVRTAIAILDRVGPRGLTLRGLAAELGGGLGSVYWYVDGKDALVELACDALVGEALDRAAEGTGPARGPQLETDDPDVVAAVAELRRTALALFEQAQQHPWLPLQLHGDGAGTPNALRFWERLGRSLAAMGLSKREQFFGSTAVNGYVTGVAAAMAAQGGQADLDRPKAEQLDEIVTGWLATDPQGLTWLGSVADEFRRHDDDEQFVAGLDLLIGGLVRQAVQRREAAGAGRSRRSSRR